MHGGSLALLLAGSAAVAVVHSILPDHWVPLAVVARTQKWSLAHVGRISALAAAGHVVASLALAAIVALIGLRFQQQINSQQGHIVGAVLVLTGIGFFLWGLTGHGHSHPHGEGGHRHGEDHPSHRPEDGSHEHRPEEADAPEHHQAHEHDAEHEHGADDHDHEHAAPALDDQTHGHEHAHAGVVHSHAHSHAVFIAHQQDRLTQISSRSTLAGRLATIAVPFGVAASPDLTILPIVLAAAAYGTGAVVSALAIFATLTIGTFVALTVVATAAGYQVKGEWLEKNANTITSLVLVAIGIVAFFGF